MMKKLLLSSFFLFSILSLFAQTWDGGGDGTSWNDPLNWDNDIVPAAGVTASFNNNVTVVVTGTAPNTPARLMVDNGSTVTIDMDLAVGDGIVDEHCVKVQANGVLNLGVAGNNRTITLTPGFNRFAILHNANNNPATINISPSTTVDIVQGNRGVSMTNSGNNILNNEGTLNVMGNVTGVLLETGALNNLAGGVINVNTPNDMGIEMTGGNLNNAGTINATINASSMNDDYAIFVGMGTTLDNTGVIMTSGGTGGVIQRRIFVDGTAINNPCGLIDVGDGRLRVNDGTFTNNGLFRSSRPTGAGLFISGAGSAMNNAFYDYSDASAGFGASNNGVNINDPADMTLDAASSCAVADLGIDAAYDWFSDETNNAMVGSNDGAGALPFDNGVFASAGTQTIYTCYGNEAAFTVQNVDGACVAALPPPPPGPAAIPTMSEWGMILFALLMLNIGVVFVLRQQVAMVGGMNSSLSFGSLPFNRVFFGKYFVRILAGITLVGLLSITVFGYELMPFDVPGSILGAGLLAYLFLLICRGNKNS